MITAYGKHYASLYRGSLYGKGAIKFAVMGYVIANQTPKTREPDSAMEVELNAAMLAGILGESEKDVNEAIEFLCSPDKNSRSKDEDGRRLVKEGQFVYRVVNGRYYRNLADQEKRAEQLRRASLRYRAREKWRLAGLPLVGEKEYVAAVERDAPDWELEAIERKYAPKEKV